MSRHDLGGCSSRESAKRINPGPLPPPIRGSGDLRYAVAAWAWGSVRTKPPLRELRMRVKQLKAQRSGRKVADCAHCRAEIREPQLYLVLGAKAFHAGIPECTQAGFALLRRRRK